MSNEKNNQTPPKKYRPSARFAIPFFIVLTVLTVVSFIIPLRPERSYSEKRNLAQFPDFSVEALVSGSYFDDINTWFSDTFPGRESWIRLAGATQELHGQSDIVIHGELPVQTPEMEQTEPIQTRPTETTEPEATQEPAVEETIVLQEEAPPTAPVEEWGGVDAGSAEINLGATIQIGDTAFAYFGYSEPNCEWYTNIVNNLVEKLDGTGVRVVNALPPTGLGVMVEDEYMEMLGCEPQTEAVDLINGLLDERVYTVDTVRTLIPHNDEYLFFRTDHHWTATAAYYVYDAICQELGYESAPLDSFTEWDQGTFVGSFYSQCKQSSKLRKDNVIAYVSDSNISCMLCKSDGKGFQWPMLTDMTRSNENSKYMTFLAGDHALSILTNNDLPDGPNCIVVKNSHGNCLAPFLAENYHNVYVIDYRKYYGTTISKFVEQYDIQDVILAPSLDAVQGGNVLKTLQGLLK